MAIEVETGSRVEAVDVTDRVAEAVPGDVRRGTCTVFVRHTTAGVAVNEAEGGLLADVEATLEALVPAGAGYEHDAVDDNADAHLRAMLLGASATVPVVEGALVLGTWQSVLLVECDGPRRRRLEVVVTTDGRRS